MIVKKNCQRDYQRRRFKEGTIGLEVCMNMADAGNSNKKWETADCWAEIMGMEKLLQLAGFAPNLTNSIDENSCMHRSSCNGTSCSRFSRETDVCTNQDRWESMSAWKSPQCISHTADTPATVKSKQNTMLSNPL